MIVLSILVKQGGGDKSKNIYQIFTSLLITCLAPRWSLRRIPPCLGTLTRGKQASVSSALPHIAHFQPKQ